VRFGLSSTVICSDVKYKRSQYSQDNQVISTRKTVIGMRNQSLKETIQELTFCGRLLLISHFKNLLPLGSKVETLNNILLC